MKEKKLGRGFKVGDKVKLTKAGEESGFFTTGFREGDVAEVLLPNSFDGFVSSIKVLTGEAEGDVQYCDGILDIKPWFEHVKDKKKRKKKRKYFRMGDFVALKDGLPIEEVTTSSDFEVGMVGVISGEACDGVVTVRFINGEQCDVDFIKASALRLATKDERKTLRKHKVAKITYDNASENEQDTEIATREIPPEYDVKVGDIVEVTQYYGGYPVGTIGQVGTIDEDIEGYHNHVVVRSTDGDYWNECNVKLLHRPNMKVCSTLNYNIKVGDIVEATEDVVGQSVGKLGEVTELFCPDNPETRNIATVIDFSGETHIGRNVKLAYRKPDTNSK